MKKIVCLLMVLSMVLMLLAGCGQPEADLYVTEDLAENPLFLALVNGFNETQSRELVVESLPAAQLMDRLESGEFPSAFFLMTPEAEAALSTQEVTINEIFYDPVYIIGPREDRIGLSQLGENSADQVLKHIILTKSPFVHAASLTNLRKKEVLFWEQNGITPDPALYLEADPAEDGILKTAAEHNGYAVVERYVYEHYKDQYPTLTLLQDQCQGLVDRFCMVVQGTDTDSLAVQFANWMMDTPGQDIIYFYGMEEYGVSRYLPSIH